MKIQTCWNGLKSVGQKMLRYLTPSGGALFWVVVLLLMTDLVSAAPWNTPAQAPAGDDAHLPYQARITDASGTPIDNTSPGLDITFSIYPQASGGTAVWTEHHTGVPVSDGLFTVYLGSITPLDSALLDGEMWLGVKIGSDPEMTPRERLVSQGTGTQSSGVPVGTVISWWRADASTPLPSDEWAIADGSVVDDPESPLDGQALPDLTDRFIMGVPASDIGQTGGANVLNLSHRHRVDGHTHSIPSHSHGNGTLRASVAVEHNRIYVRRYYGASFNSTHANYTNATHSNTHTTDDSADVMGRTASWSGTSGSSRPYTSHQLSSTTDNRPQYVGLLFLVKVK